MPDLVCIWCGKIDCTSEYNLKRHLAVCSKRFSAYFNEQVNESDKQIPRFASLKNDDDYDSDNKELKNVYARGWFVYWKHQFRQWKR